MAVEVEVELNSLPNKGNFRSKEQRQRAAWRRKRLGKVEEEIFQLEEEKEELERELQDPSIASDYLALEEGTLRLEQVTTGLNKLVSEWGALRRRGKGKRIGCFVGYRSNFFIGPVWTPR